MNEHVFGFKLIKDMSREELIEEIAGIQREQLEKMEHDQLKAIIIDFRAGSFRHRLIDEAGFSEGSPYGHDHRG